MFLIIVPAYNEANTIGNLLKQIDNKYDVLVVDDGSIDLTSDLSEKLGAKVIKSEKNNGVDYSINIGFEYAVKNDYKYVVTIDADGQHSVSDLEKIIDILKNEDCDLVISQRDNLPRISEKIFSLYTYLRFGIKDLLSGLKGYNIEVFKQYGTYRSFNSIGTELSVFTLKKGYRIKKIAISVNDRKDEPRLGGIFLGNFRIIVALIRLIFKKF